MQINWQQFGLKTNPYDTFPLVEGGGLPLKEAFIGRNKEIVLLNNLFESEDNACLTICGNPGVGKTSLANFQKFTWKHNESKALFSCRREIEASDTLLDKRSFLLEIIGSVIREIELIKPKLLDNPLLAKLKAIIDFTQMMAISGGISIDVAGFGGGLNFAKDRNNSVPVQLTTTAIEQHFANLLNFITAETIGNQKYVGLIVHVNNFDVVLKDSNNKRRVIGFFNEIRDILQTKNVYFLFLGPVDFYSQIIASDQRVKSIFVRTPLLVSPLSKKEVAHAFEARMQLLKSDDVQDYIKAIPDDVVFKLYDLYGGDIRSIMTGIKDILGQCSERLLQPLSMHEAMTLLGRERWEGIKSTLTKEQQKILEFLVRNGKDVSTTEIAETLKKHVSNTSGYLKVLKNLNIVEQKEKRGKTIYLGLTTEYQPLKWWFESESAAKKDALAAGIKQQTLFDI